MTTTDNLPALNRAEKNVLRQFEAEIAGALENANRYGAIIGKALWDISDEQLYRDTHATFAEYVEDRWQMSTSKAYRLIKIAKEHAAHPELPIPSQYALEGRKNASDPKSPNLGTMAAAQPHADTEPSVIDAEGWEEPEPKALPAPAAVASERYETRAPGSGDATSAPSNGPGAVPSPEPVPTVAGQPEVPAGLAASGGEDNGVADLSALPPAEWQAITENVSAHARAVEDVTPDVRSVPSNQRREDQGEDSVTESTLAVMRDRLDAMKATPAVALIALLTSVDLDAIGTEMTADQMDTLTRAYEQIRESWTVTHKARKDWSKELRARRPVESTPVAGRSSAPLGRREVTPMFKQGKEKVAR